MITGSDARGGENSILISSAGGMRGRRQNSGKGVQANSIKCTRRSGPQPRRVEESSRIRIISAVSPLAHVIRPTRNVARLFFFLFFFTGGSQRLEVPLKANSSPPCTAAPPSSLKLPGSVSIYLIVMKNTFIYSCAF